MIQSLTNINKRNRDKYRQKERDGSRDTELNLEAEVDRKRETEILPEIEMISTQTEILTKIKR